MSVARATRNSSSAIGFHALTLISFFGASAAPTPLYRIYQQDFSVSPFLITIIFAVYAFALLASLLIAGSISDHLGRRPVIFVALLLEIIAMAMFSVANGSEWLVAARITQGLATGIASASIGAALVDINKPKGQMVNSLAPLSGMALGAVFTSALIQYGPEPLHLVYILMLLVFTAQCVALWFTHETGAKRHGAFNSLKPSIAIPQQARRPLSLVSPINLANWALGGFYLSLVPSLIASTTGSHAPLTGGSVVAALMLSGAIAVFMRHRWDPKANFAFGVPAQTIGIATVVAGVHFANVPLLLVGTLFTGSGFGTNFLASIGAIMPLARPEERAGLLSAFYIQSYLAFSIPAILAGLLSKSIGYRATTDIYAALIIVISIAGLLRMWKAKQPVVV